MIVRQIFCLLFAVIPQVLEGANRDTLYRRYTSYNDPTVLPRFKRDTVCGYWGDEFQCRDGTCIAANKKCDGTVDCPDGTDETHYLCRETRCPEYMFRCTYGACVDGEAPCDGVIHCVDNSDELQPRCNNRSFVIGDQFKCDDNSLVELYQRCDGLRDCADGSDETLAACAAHVCPADLFQCAYGACVDELAMCNGILDCADGSDETDMLCKRRRHQATTRPTTTTTEPTILESSSMCTLPPHPENGRYVKNGDSAAYVPGQTLATVFLNVSCLPGYKALGEEVVICYEGRWYPHTLPSCVRACEVKPHHSVEYKCLISAPGAEGTRRCEPWEPEGTVALPECRQPDYYNLTALPPVTCLDGRWSWEPVCQARCGTLTPRAQALVAGGARVRRGELPWHVAVYARDGARYGQICGGSLLSEGVFITAAHCFWQDGYGLLDAGQYAAAVGKLYRDWYDPRDLAYAQYSEIEKIHVPSHFGGLELLYQDDLAVVVVKNRFTFRSYIRPVCLDFSPNFNAEQLTDGNMGKVAGWDLTHGQDFSELKVVDLPVVGWQQCRRRTPPDNRQFIVGKKFCGGFGNATTVCKGDSGGGYVFPLAVQGELHYYLRGVVSTSPRAPGACNLHALVAFTELQPYEAFVRRHLAPPH